MKTQNVTSKYNEYEVLKSVARKKALDINHDTKLISLSTEVLNDVGIKTKGKLDYLRKYCGWTIII